MKKPACRLYKIGSKQRVINTLLVIEKCKRRILNIDDFPGDLISLFKVNMKELNLQDMAFLTTTGLRVV